MWSLEEGKFDWILLIFYTIGEMKERLIKNGFSE